MTHSSGSHPEHVFWQVTSDSAARWPVKEALLSPGQCGPPASDNRCYVRSQDEPWKEEVALLHLCFLYVVVWPPASRSPLWTSSCNTGCCTRWLLSTLWPLPWWDEPWWEQHREGQGEVVCSLTHKTLIKHLLSASYIELDIDMNNWGSAHRSSVQDDQKGNADLPLQAEHSLNDLARGPWLIHW